MLNIAHLLSTPLFRYAIFKSYTQNSRIIRSHFINDCVCFAMHNNIFVHINQHDAILCPQNLTCKGVKCPIIRSICSQISMCFSTFSFFVLEEEKKNTECINYQIYGVTSWPPNGTVHHLFGCGFQCKRRWDFVTAHKFFV